MFRIILALVLIGGVIWISSTMNRRKISLRALWIRIKNELNIFTNFKNPDFGTGIFRLRRIMYLLTLIFFLILAVSAYLHLLISGSPLTGWLLIAHVTAAPLFAVCLILSVLIWVHKQRFNRQDWLIVQQSIRQGKITGVQQDQLTFWHKINFWIFVLAAIPALLSIVFQLYPLFDSEGMLWLLQIHRYSTLVLFLVLIFHVRLVLLGLNQNK
jgi:hypothetical protein